MKKLQTTLLIFLTVSISYSQDLRMVMGTVSNGNGPLNSVDISVANDDAKTISQDDGSYRIPVKTGDVLTYNSQGMEPVKIKVEDVTRVLNVDLSPRIEKLKNVTVTKGKRRSLQGFNTKFRKKKDLINTVFGPLDLNRATYTVRTLESDQILQGEYNLVNVLRGRFPGLTLGSSGISRNNRLGRGLVGFTGSANVRSVFLRGDAPAAFDIDGQLFRDFPYFLDVQNIQRIAIIPSLAGTIRYGSFGRGGVVIINTKTGSSRFNRKGDSYDKELKLYDNYFDGTVLTAENIQQSAPTYLKELSSANSLNEAKSIYETNSLKYANSPYFVLDAYEHFYNDRNDVAYADDIIKNKYGLFKNNAVLLKALAYIYESQGRFDLAHKTSKKAFILRPSYAQSYLDLANSNRNLKKQKRAAVLYSRYYYLLKKGMFEKDSSGFSKIINREFNNLLSSKNQEVLGKKKAGKMKLEEEDFDGTRLVFEWNDSEAEFDLQFVSPNKQHYTWKHTLKENPDKIMQEKNVGYSCSEYLIDDALAGNWKVNIKYQGNKSLTPTYLKATIYHNYGSKLQRKEIKVFKLDVKNVNRELFAVAKSPSIASR